MFRPRYYLKVYTYHQHDVSQHTTVALCLYCSCAYVLRCSLVALQLRVHMCVACASPYGMLAFTMGVHTFNYMLCEWRSGFTFSYTPDATRVLWSRVGGCARVLITVSDPGPFTPRPNAGVVFAAYGWFSRPGLFAPTGFLFRFEIQKIRCKT